MQGDLIFIKDFRSRKNQLDFDGLGFGWILLDGISIKEEFLNMDEILFKDEFSLMGDFFVNRWMLITIK